MAPEESTGTFLSQLSPPATEYMFESLQKCLCVCYSIKMVLKRKRYSYNNFYNRFSNALTELMPMYFVGLTKREACNKCFVIVYVIKEHNISRL
jgi:hypothetical protein